MGREHTRVHVLLELVVISRDVQVVLWVRRKNPTSCDVLRVLEIRGLVSKSWAPKLIRGLRERKWPTAGFLTIPNNFVGGGMWARMLMCGHGLWFLWPF